MFEDESRICSIKSEMLREGERSARKKRNVQVWHTALRFETIVVVAEKVDPGRTVDFSRPRSVYADAWNWSPAGWIMCVRPAWEVTRHGTVQHEVVLYYALIP